MNWCAGVTLLNTGDMVSRGRRRDKLRDAERLRHAEMAAGLGSLAPNTLRERNVARIEAGDFDAGDAFWDDVNER